MSENDKSRNQSKASGAADVGQAEVKQKFDEANEKGYFGTVTDPTPNANYTFAGQAKGAPTPETDEQLRAEAQKARNQ
ncbi:MAG TPA: hypothetical protein VM450_11705 [Thermomicrobiales bacterium]|nr:hypothetical protein [Thermomicrobiales bacterium]